MLGRHKQKQTCAQRRDGNHSVAPAPAGHKEQFAPDVLAKRPAGQRAHGVYCESVVWPAKQAEQPLYCVWLYTVSSMLLSSKQYQTDGQDKRQRKVRANERQGARTRAMIHIRLVEPLVIPDVKGFIRRTFVQSRTEFDSQISSQPVDV